MKNYNKTIKTLGIRKERIAQVLGISVPLFSQYLNGKRTLPDSHKKKLDTLLKNTRKALKPLGLC